MREIEEKKYVLRDESFEWDMSRDINMICHKCGKPLSRQSPGQWVRQNQSNVSGYHINQLFSTTTKTKELAKEFNEALVNDSKMQDFYNLSLGLAYTAAGSKITFDMLNKCKRDYPIKSESAGPCIIGIDIGNTFHTVISEITPDKQLKVIWFGELNGVRDIFEMVKIYKIKFGVIDALPEAKLVKDVCYKLPGFFRCYYGNVKTDTVNVEHKIVTVERTQAIDSVKESILLENILLPQNADKVDALDNNFSAFYNHINNSTRVYDKEKEAYSWIEGSKPDHFLHSLVYLTLARKLIIKSM